MGPSDEGQGTPLCILMIDPFENLAGFVPALDHAKPNHCRIRVCRSFADARGLLAEAAFDVVVTDLPIDIQDSAAALKALVSACTLTPVVVLCSDAEADWQERVLRYGAQDYLVARFTDGPALLRSVLHAIRRKELENRLRTTLGDLAQANAHLQRMTSQDVLTGAMNRRAFIEVTERALLRAQRHQRRVALIYFDLDDFKQINDRYGHASGDRLLTTFCSRVKPFLRGSDQLARLGGDEFAALIEDIASPRHAYAAAKRIRDALGQPVIVDGHTIRPRASIGIALSAQNVSVDTLIQQADAAMYTAKRSGTGIRFYDTELDRRHKARERLRDDLRNGGVDELRVHYQPVSDRHGNAAFVRALLRWQHPRFGRLCGDEFLSLAAHDEMRAMTDFVLDRAGADWRCRLTRAGAGGVSVSLTTADLHDPQLAERIAARLGPGGIPAAQLYVSFPEDALARNPDAGRRTLYQLRALGVRLALENFGYGDLSVATLHRLPLDLVTLDPVLVAGVDTKPDLARLCRANTQLARALGLGVLAQGVATRTELQTLAEAGCALFQGDYIGAARPLDDDAPVAITVPRGALPWVEPEVRCWALRGRAPTPLWKRRLRRQHRYA